MTRVHLISVICCLLAGLTAAAEDKEIYGTDDRREPFQVLDPALRQMMEAVCVLLYVENLRENDDGTFTILHKPNLFRGPEESIIGLCPDEPYADQPYVGICTAFLVAPDLVATAGHCAVGRHPARLRLVFGWEMLDPQTPAETVPADQVYRVAEVLEQVADARLDHAVLRLDRPVSLPGVAPLPVRLEGRIPDGALVGVIGHPFGIPKKIAFGPRTRVYDNFWPAGFTTNIDASAGNSGSPVINQVTGQVEGIYVSSRVDDLLLDGDCFRLNRVDDAAAEQGVMRSSTFAHLLPGGSPKFLALCGCAPNSRRSGWAGDVLVMLIAGAFVLGVRRRMAAD